MKGLIFALALAISAGCASVPDVANEYSGADAGRVAIGIGTAKGTYYNVYSLFFRKVGEKKSDRFAYFHENMFTAQKRDYENALESGVVQSFRLSPGDYEIFNFSIFLNGGTVQNTYGSKQEFSIPFTVKSNETTYLGNYQANKVMGKNFFGLPLPAGAVFIVSNREKDDLELVKKRITNVAFGAVINATPVVATIRNPFFVDSSDKLESAK